MNLAMFIVGAIIFSVYVAFLMWNIFFNHNKNKEENYPGYYVRHKQPDNIEVMTEHYPHNTKKRKPRRSDKRKYKKNIIE
jgi:hypothetical protein